VCGGGNIFGGGVRLVWRPSLNTFGGGGLGAGWIIGFFSCSDGRCGGGGGGRGDGRRGRRRGSGGRCRSGGNGGRCGGRRSSGGNGGTLMALSMQLVCDSIIPWKMMNANK